MTALIFGLKSPVVLEFQTPGCNELLLVMHVFVLEMFW
jgi:hypothetical protein